jgi:hypothetical protein
MKYIYVYPTAYFIVLFEFIIKNMYTINNNKIKLKS